MPFLVCAWNTIMEPISVGLLCSVPHLLLAAPSPGRSFRRRAGAACWKIVSLPRQLRPLSWLLSQGAACGTRRAACGAAGMFHVRAAPGPAAGGANWQPAATRAGSHCGTRPLPRRWRPGLGQRCTARGLLHAGIHREDTDQASGFQHPQYLLLRGGEGQVTAASAGPSQHAHQDRQGGIADGFQTRQVHDHPGPARRDGHDQMRRDTGRGRQVKIPAQRDDRRAAVIADAEIHVEHGPSP